MSKIVTAALIRRRREVMCDINRLQADIAAIDRVLCLFDPDMKPEQIPALTFYRGEGWAANGEVSRAVMNTLRRSETAMTTGQIVDAMGGDDREKQARRAYKVLCRFRDRGIIRASKDDRGTIWWGITPPAANTQPTGAICGQSAPQRQP